MSIGVIDIGSNTVRLAVYETDTFKVIQNGVNYAGLIAFVDGGKISDEGVDVLCSAVEQMISLCKTVNCENYYAFATASLRDIDDKAGLIDKVLKRCGVKMEIVSGEREAELDYLGLLMHYNVKDGAVFDLGGGSGQLITFKDGKVLRNISKKIGALKVYKTFVEGTFPTEEEEERIREYVRCELSEFESEKHEFVFAMGGAASAIKKIYKAVFGECRDEFKIRDLKAFLELPENVISSVVPERLYTIKPALIAIEEIAAVLKTDAIKCVTCGVRDGMIYELMKGSATK